MRFLLLSSILILLASCGSADPALEKYLAGTWRLSDVTEDNAKSGDGDALLRSARMRRDLAKGKILSLFADGSYTEVDGEGAYTAGRWKLTSDKELGLQPDGGDGVKMPVTAESINEKEALALGTSGGRKLHYLRTGTPLKDEKQDPFHPENNSWRLPPKAAESDEQLTARLANYFRHAAYVLKSSEDRNQDVVSFEFSRGPVKIYAGSIGILPEEALHESWYRTFYSKQDAMKAYALYEHYLDNNHYRGASTGKWAMDDYKILESIYADCKEGKFLK